MKCFGYQGCPNPIAHSEGVREWCEECTPWSGHYEWCYEDRPCKAQREKLSCIKCNELQQVKKFGFKPKEIKIPIVCFTCRNKHPKPNVSYLQLINSKNLTDKGIKDE